MILLQHDGLSLGQLDNMISYRIPTTWSGRHSIKMALVILMMFPSPYIAPLVSGAIDWRSTEMYQAHSETVIGGFGRFEWDEVSDWFFNDHMLSSYQFALASGAFQCAVQSWDFINGDLMCPEGTYRYIAIQAAKPTTRVENVPMPFIKVHSITWDDNWPAWAQSIVFDQRKIRYGAVFDSPLNFASSGMVFDNDTTLPNSLLNSATVFEARKKVAMVTSHGENLLGSNCTATFAGLWDGMENITLKVDKQGNHCYALGTIHFTAGIMYFPIGTYINNHTVEARLDSRVDSMTKSRLIGDPWAEYCSKILTEPMHMIPLMYPGTTDHRPRNLTQATEVLVRQSYLAVRQQLGVHIPDPRNLTTQSLTLYLEARVDHIRVLTWLVLNIMVGGAGCIIGLVELGSKGRPEVISTVLAPLMTDVREILVADENGISGISYLTRKDKKSIKKVRLKSIRVPEPQGSHASRVSHESGESKESRGKTVWGLGEK